MGFRLLSDDLGIVYTEYRIAMLNNSMEMGFQEGKRGRSARREEFCVDFSNLAHDLLC